MHYKNLVKNHCKNQMAKEISKKISNTYYTIYNWRSRTGKLYLMWSYDGTFLIFVIAVT